MNNRRKEYNIDRIREIANRNIENFLRRLNLEIDGPKSPYKSSRVNNDHYVRIYKTPCFKREKKFGYI